MSSSTDGGVMDGRIRNDSLSRPPPGKTYLAIGQDFFSIQEYLLSQYNASLHRPDGRHISGEVGDRFRSASTIFPLTHFHPACTMAYTDIYELKGLDQPADYGSGVEYVKGLAEAFPESGLQIGLWLNGSPGCRDIVSGALNDKVHRLFDFIHSDLPESVPKVFLRVGYEFDNPWFGFSDDPEVYQEAFRVLVRACEIQLTSNLCHEKIVFVWHSWAAPRYPDLALDQFYPGDSFVDWIGVSIFQQLYPWANDEDDESGNFAGGTMNQVKEVLEFAKVHDKPIMIAESTPFGGMNVIQSSIAKKYIQNDSKNNDIWNLWFQKTIDLIEEYDISMWSYINCDWESQPMWRNVGFGDTRLSSLNVVMNHWWDQVLSNNTRFMRRIKSHDKRPYSGSSQGEEGIETDYVALQYGSLKNIETTTTRFQNDGEMKAQMWSNYLPCFVGIVFLIVMVVRTMFRAQRYHQVKTSISESFDLPNSNGRGEYGSLGFCD